MLLVRRVLGTIVLLLSTAVIACCAAGIIGIWRFHQAAYDRIETITGRLDSGLQQASAAGQTVQGALDQAP